MWYGPIDKNARFRLFCFPHAGGGAAIYMRFKRHLSCDVVPLFLPGRDRRLSERPFTIMTPLVDAIAEAIEPILDTPFAFFGHSMGALLAFEVARRLRDNKAPLPTQLLISSRRAPHLPDRDPPCSRLPDRQFINTLQQRYNALPQVVVDDPELLAVFLPILRADYTMIENWRFRPAPPLPFSIHGFHGTREHTTAAEIAPWAEHTSKAFAMTPITGGHFYFVADPKPLLKAMGQVLGCP
ncbi:MAG: thioesterase [Proteobacteria bacterium]|jgi:medium-chain acyl-[acyl-carrier-protein] hydrolase|nr:thioesterase [Pseudomonadota bacterium]